MSARRTDDGTKNEERRAKLEAEVAKLSPEVRATIRGEIERSDVAIPEPHAQRAGEPLRSEYHVGYSVAKELSILAEGARELAAIERLANFRGDRNDVITAAAIYDRAGEGANAAELRRLLPPVQVACDRCTNGVLDQDNPHLHGRCSCECHRQRESEPQKGEGDAKGSDSGSVARVDRRAAHGSGVDPGRGVREVASGGDVAHAGHAQEAGASHGGQQVARPSVGAGEVEQRGSEPLDDRGPELGGPYCDCGHHPSQHLRGVGACDAYNKTGEECGCGVVEIAGKTLLDVARREQRRQKPLRSAGPLRIYVASSWRNTIQPEIVRELRALGCDVYDFREPAPGVSGFSWSEIDPAWKDWTPAAYRDALKHPIAARGYGYDIAALRACDVCVLVLPSGRSASWEFGYAMGEGKRGIVVSLDKCEPELMYREAEIVTTIAELRSAVQRCAEPQNGGRHGKEEEQRANDRDVEGIDHDEQGATRGGAGRGDRGTDVAQVDAARRVPRGRRDDVPRDRGEDSSRRGSGDLPSGGDGRVEPRDAREPSSSEVAQRGERPLRAAARALLEVLDGPLDSMSVDRTFRATNALRAAVAQDLIEEGKDDGQGAADAGIAQCDVVETDERGDGEVLGVQRSTGGGLDAVREAQGTAPDARGGASSSSPRGEDVEQRSAAPPFDVEGEATAVARGIERHTGLVSSDAVYATMRGEILDALRRASGQRSLPKDPSESLPPYRCAQCGARSRLAVLRTGGFVCQDRAACEQRSAGPLTSNGVCEPVYRNPDPVVETVDLLSVGNIHTGPKRAHRIDPPLVLEKDDEIAIYIAKKDGDGSVSANGATSGVDAVPMPAVRGVSDGPVSEEEERSRDSSVARDARGARGEREEQRVERPLRKGDRARHLRSGWEGTVAHVTPGEVDRVFVEGDGGDGSIDGPADAFVNVDDADAARQRAATTYAQTRGRLPSEKARLELAFFAGAQWEQRCEQPQSFPLSQEEIERLMSSPMREDIVAFVRGDFERFRSWEEIKAKRAAQRSSPPLRWGEGDRCRILIGEREGDVAIVEGVDPVGPFPIKIRFADGATRRVRTGEIGLALGMLGRLSDAELARLSEQLEAHGDALRGSVSEAMAACAVRCRLAAGALRDAAEVSSVLARRLGGTS